MVERKRFSENERSKQRNSKRVKRDPSKIEKKDFDKEAWKPKTELGRRVKAGEIKTIDEIIDSGLSIKEVEIVDALVPTIEANLMKIGQSKGKFGGGKRSVWKQTQKKTKEGNKPNFSTLIIAGNKEGIIGIGHGKAKETVPAREKALRKSKLNIIKIKRGCGSWECGCKDPHSIPFKVVGKSGGVRITLIPAPKGTGLVLEEECKKVVQLAGIKDLYAKVIGKTKSNLILACFDALRQLSRMK